MSKSESQKFEHPSYGMVGLSKVSGRGRLFGSSVDHHHFITLTIHQARMVRELNNDHYYPGEEVMEIALSPAQLSEMLTSMNIGHGVPCTIRRMPVGGQYRMIEAPPKSIPTNAETYVRELKEHVATVIKDAETLLVEAKDVAEKTTANKTERRAVAEKLARVVMELRSNMPFIFDQYVERVEKVSAEAKAEIEAFRQLSQQYVPPSKQLQSMDPNLSCKDCAGTGELPSGDGCGCEA